MIEERGYFWMGYIILAIVVFIPLIMVMQKTAEGNAFNERLISNDITLLADMVLGVNGDVEVEYDINNTQEDFYAIGFTEDCEVSVAYKDTSILSASRSICADNLNLEKQGLDFSEYSSLVMEKNDDRFSISGGIS